jgi:hypothetical protein
MSAKRELALIADSPCYVDYSNARILSSYFQLDLPFRKYFTGNNTLDAHLFMKLDSKRVRDFTLETPAGIETRVVGYRLDESELRKLSPDSAEFLFLEIVKSCNFSCPHCGPKSNHTNKDRSLRSVIEESPYITEDFLDEFLPLVAAPHGYLRHRTIFITGGEPTINMQKFSRIYRRLSEAFSPESNTVVLLTNGFFIPVDKDKKQEFFGLHPGLFYDISASESLESQYASLAGKAQNEDFNREYLGKIGSVTDFLDIKKPSSALFSKISSTLEYCLQNDIPIRLTILESGVNRTASGSFAARLSQYLISRLGETTVKDLFVNKHPIYDFNNRNQGLNMDVCSTQTELYINCSEGKLFTGCQQAFAGRHHLPRIGFIKMESQVH